jgi:hypothetical protein
VLSSHSVHLPPTTFFGLFRFHTRTEIILNCFGLIFAAAAGVAQVSLPSRLLLQQVWELIAFPFSFPFRRPRLSTALPLPRPLSSTASSSFLLFPLFQPGMTLLFGKLSQALTDFATLRAQGIAGAALSAAEKHFFSEVRKSVLILVYIGLGACSSCSFFNSSSTRLFHSLFFLLQASQRLSICSCGCAAARLPQGASARPSKPFPSSFFFVSFFPPFSFFIFN